MQFTSDWFSTNIPVWESLFGSFERDKAYVGLEIGSYEGRSAIWLLENVLTHKDSQIFCIDVFPNSESKNESYFARFKDNIKKFKEKVHIYPGFSYNHLVDFNVRRLSFDFIYVDGSHRASEVLEDLILSFKLLKPGGLLICDDYLGGAGSNLDVTLGSPKFAIDAFTTLYRDRVEIIPGMPLYQIYMRKIRDRDRDDLNSRAK